MKRYLRYLAAAGLAFLVGIGFVYLYISKLTRQITELPLFSEECIPESSHPSLETLEKSLAEIRPISGMEIILALYQPTISKWQKGERIPNIVHHSPEIVAEISELGKRLEIVMRLETRDIYKTQIADLNGDKQNELIILQRNYEEFRADHETWNIFIFQKDKKRIRLIFDEGMVNDFRILKTKTKGFLDLALVNRYEEEMHSFTQVFRSNGEIHDVVRCYSEIYGYQDRKGKWRKLKKPRIVPGMDCC